jgi:hypothetical protein
MTDLDETVDTWLAAWTEPDDATRLDLIGQVCAAEGKLADPPPTTFPPVAHEHSDAGSSHATNVGRSRTKDDYL